MSSLSDRHMSSFQAEYRPLSESRPGLGLVALLPWDEAVFGFPVADLRIGPDLPKVDDIPRLRKALLSYSRRTGAELVSVRVAARQTSLSAVLSRVGFVYVDLGLLATLPKLEPGSLLKTRFAVRRAEPADHDDIYQICGNEFDFGRYHTDPHFPRELANRRYLHWIRRALASTDSGDIVFVLGRPGKVSGFMHVALHENNADLRLGAVAPGSPLGFWLYTETLRAIHALGAKCVSTGISAANVKVMQIYAALGFRFSRPEVILHWHSPGTVRLISDPDAPGAD